MSDVLVQPVFVCIREHRVYLGGKVEQCTCWGLVPRRQSSLIQTRQQLHQIRCYTSQLLLLRRRFLCSAKAFQASQNLPHELISAGGTVGGQRGKALEELHLDRAMI